MDITSDIKATGKLVIEHFGGNGELLDTRSINNLVVTIGKEFIASRMVGTADAIMSHMAVGTSATAPAVGDTALGTQVGIVALSTSTATGTSVTYTATFGAGIGTGALVEAGIFNAASAGDLLCRTTFPVVNKGAGDTIAITWVVTVS